MVNKIVYIVHHGLIRPQDGARILHSSASIIGLPLIRELRRNVLIVQGLVKSNDLAVGHDMLVQTFSPFGDILDASIAPQNRGFGKENIIIHLSCSVDLYSEFSILIMV